MYLGQIIVAVTVLYKMSVCGIEYKKKDSVSKFGLALYKAIGCYSTVYKSLAAGCSVTAGQS